MSNILSIYIIFLVVLSIAGYSLLIYFTRSVEHDDGASESKHTFDGIRELNEPLPGWWLWLFIISIIFGICYLVLYPGLGKNKGFLNWTSHKGHEEKTTINNKLYEPIYISYYKESIEDLSDNLKALKIGKSLFLNNCSLCHGIDARGGYGFPNLTNNKWLYGGTPKDIKMTITNGRRGKMPAYGEIIGNDDDIESTALYVLSLSVADNSEQTLIGNGKVKFSKICSACHGLNAKGNKYIGAPDLTNPQWIYGGGLDDIKYTIKNGRSAIMPAHKDILTKEQIHLLVSYIYSLNKNSN